MTNLNEKIPPQLRPRESVDQSTESSTLFASDMATACLLNAKSSDRLARQLGIESDGKHFMLIGYAPVLFSITKGGITLLAGHHPNANSGHTCYGDMASMDSDVMKAKGFFLEETYDVDSDTYHYEINADSVEGLANAVRLFIELANWSDALPGAEPVLAWNRILIAEFDSTLSSVLYTPERYKIISPSSPAYIGASMALSCKSAMPNLPLLPGQSPVTAPTPFLGAAPREEEDVGSYCYSCVMTECPLNRRGDNATPRPAPLEAACAVMTAPEKALELMPNTLAQALASALATSSRHRFYDTHGDAMKRVSQMTGFDKPFFASDEGFRNLSEDSLIKDEDMDRLVKHYLSILMRRSMERGSTIERKPVPEFRSLACGEVVNLVSCSRDMQIIRDKARELIASMETPNE